MPVKTRRIDLLPKATESPAREPIPLGNLRRGSKAGWLTLESRPVSARDRVLARCSCGSATYFEAGSISVGAVRSCGLLDIHGTY